MVEVVVVVVVFLLGAGLAVSVAGWSATDGEWSASVAAQQRMVAAANGETTERKEDKEDKEHKATQQRSNAAIHECS